LNVHHELSAAAGLTLGGVFDGHMLAWAAIQLNSIVRTLPLPSFWPADSILFCMFSFAG
jgi:hypothetical protein